MVKLRFLLGRLGELSGNGGWDDEMMRWMKEKKDEGWEFK